MPAFQISATATGASGVIPIDLPLFKNGVGLLVTFPTGVTGNVDLQVTGAKPTAPGGLSAATNWNQHEVLYDLTESMNGNLAYPVTGVRLFVNSIAGNVGVLGGIVLCVVQAES